MIELKEYFSTLILEEQDLVTELLNIDNEICFTNWQVEDLITKIKEVKILPQTPELFNIITSGELDEILTALINYPLNIKRIYVDKKLLGISTYLISRLKRLLENVNLELDKGNDYSYYLKSKDTLVILGDRLYVKQMAQLFTSTKVIEISVN